MAKSKINKNHESALATHSRDNHLSSLLPPGLKLMGGAPSQHSPTWLPRTLHPHAEGPLSTHPLTSRPSEHTEPGGSGKHSPPLAACSLMNS